MEKESDFPEVDILTLSLKYIGDKKEYTEESKRMFLVSPVIGEYFDPDKMGAMNLKWRDIFKKIALAFQKTNE